MSVDRGMALTGEVITLEQGIDARVPSDGVRRTQDATRRCSRCKDAAAQVIVLYRNDVATEWCNDCWRIYEPNVRTKVVNVVKL